MKNNKKWHKWSTLREREKARKLYEDGFLVREVAQRLHRSEMAIYSWIDGDEELNWTNK